MAIYMLTMWFPWNKTEEIQKEAAKITKLPPYIKKWQILGATDEKSAKVYNIIYTDDTKIAEANLWITKVMGIYNGIEGFTWKIELVASQRDTQKVQSMKL